MRLALFAVAAVLAMAAPAEAAFTLANPAAKPADVAAGAHSDFAIHVEPQGGDIKDLVLHLPRGVIGDPNATPRCTIAQFESNSCPTTTQVGRAANQIQLGPLSQRAEGEIFNVQPRGAEPARLGIKVNSPTGGEPIRLESPVTSRSTDGGLDSTLKDIPNTFQGFDITITAPRRGAPGGRPGRRAPGEKDDDGAGDGARAQRRVRVCEARRITGDPPPLG